MVKLLSACLLVVLSASAIADLVRTIADSVTLHKIDDSDCFEVPVSLEHKEHIIDIAALGLSVGTCSSNGFSTEVPGGSVALQVPFLKEPLTLTRMTRSSWELAKIKAQAYFAPVVNLMLPRPAMQKPQQLPRPVMQKPQQLDLPVNVQQFVVPRLPVKLDLGGIVKQPQHGSEEPDPPNDRISVPTVSSLDLDAFLGRWYQMYSSISSTILTFGTVEQEDVCVSADYSLNQDGETIDVLNQGINKDGTITQIRGQARATNQPGRRKLSFKSFLRGDRTKTPPDFEGDYWIHKLGPKVNGVYSYVVLGGPVNPKLGLDQTQLFVLARDPTTWSMKFDEQVKTWLREKGFSWWWNEPRRTGSLGSWRWLPFPKFRQSDGSRGEFGQNDCAELKELAPPVDGRMDPRLPGMSGRVALV